MNDWRVICVLGLVAVTGLGPSANGQCSQAVLEPGSVPGMEFDLFGSPRKIAISGHTLAVGVNRTTVNQQSSAGSVHVFERQGVGWARTSLLLPSQPVPQYALGRAVAVCGDTLFAGTRANSDQGSVLVYERQGGLWSIVQELLPIPSPGNASFGSYVHLLERRAVVLAGSQERIYLFEKQGPAWVMTSWADEGVLAPYPFDSGQNVFATSIAVDGQRVVVANVFGPVYVIEYDASGVWTAIAELSIPGVHFSLHTIAIDGNTVAIGETSYESVFIFDEGPNGWSHTQTLSPSDLQPGQWFGANVHLFQDRLLVGSTRGSSVVDREGAAYVFERVGSTWVETVKLTPAVSVTRDLFGAEVVVWGDQALVGAPGGATAPTLGTVHVYDLEGHQGSAYCPTNPNSSGQAASLTSYGSRRAILSCLSLDVDSLPLNQFGYFVMAREQGFLPLVGGGEGNFCLGFPFIRLAGDIQNSGAMGSASFSPDLGNLPGGAIAPGETWNFQYWTRDGATSNLSNGLAITFTTGDESAVQFPVTEASVEEETTTLEVTISLSEPTHDDVLVPFTTGGTATYDVDWRIEEPNPIVIPGGEISCEITILVAEDSGQEGDETGVVTLGTPTGGVLGTAPEFTLTIVDDD